MVASNKVWTVQDANTVYNLDRWSEGYFRIDSGGFLTVRNSTGDEAESGVRVRDIVQEVRSRGVCPPLLIRFPGIIEQRSRQIHGAFAEAIDSLSYRGDYRCFYPVKVNAHAEVMRASAEAVVPFGGGLEAGSKAELLAVLASTSVDVPVLCNGFKDRDIIEMALVSRQLGRNTIIIIEKLSELKLVQRCAEKIGIEPKLGIRVKLAARSGGHWQSSVGAKSKFGLSAPQLVQAIHDLETAGNLHWLKLLHFHAGSQINNIRRIKACLIEASRIYVDLIKRGIDLETIDIGGGLAVDYTGNRNSGPSSMNYSLKEYARDVIHHIGQVCDHEGVRHPNIISESGRALVAHHSLIVVPVIGTGEANVHGPSLTSIEDQRVQSSPPLVELKEIHDSIETSTQFAEDFHDAQTAIETVGHLFAAGVLSLEQRAIAEKMAWSICTKINQALDRSEFVQPELQELRHQLATTYFGNFSLFQATPDSWALDHLFPVLPLQRLGERPTVNAKICDITCDSDGQIGRFIGEGTARDSLPLHCLSANESEPYYLGIFLIGAYQEALSDDHNLMGKFHVVNVPSGLENLNQIEVQVGSSLDDVLLQVHHQTSKFQTRILEQIEQAKRCGGLSENRANEVSRYFKGMLSRYTYLNQE